MVLSKPFFYNVIQGEGGKIYVGTSKGIFEMNGTSLIPYDEKKVGYIINDERRLPKIDPDGIRYYKEKKYLHLLPYPEMAREEFHASEGDLFYICSGGRLYIYDLISYGYSYPNHSFRTISKDLLGTYSGIYLKGKKLPPKVGNYTDGYIRQFGDRAFICNYDIAVLEKQDIENGTVDSNANLTRFSYSTQTLINDIFPSPDKRYYYVASEKKLSKVDYSFKRDTVLFNHDQKDAPVGLITQDEFLLYFFANNKLFALNYKTDNMQTLVTLDKPILAGVYHEHQLYLLTSSVLYRLNSGQQLEKIVDLDKAHSIVQLSGSELVISTDNGLFLFNVASRILSPIIEGVEFNRKALHKEGDQIFAGSISGLYTINSKDIPLLIEKNKLEQDYVTSANNTKLLTTVIVIAIIVIGLISFIFRRKIIKANKIIEVLQVPKETVTREKIEEFILRNLSTASIKTITDKFEMNAPQVYAILKPDRPGSIIQKHRLETFKKMKGEGRSIDEIALATGLSTSYLKRLKA